MHTKPLGRTDTAIPEVGLGTWKYSAGTDPLLAGLEAGALFIDTAESYGTEPVVGEALRRFGRDVFIATKISPQHFRPADVRAAVQGSLARLGVEVIGLIQLHEPNSSIPIAETAGALQDLVRAGLVQYVGVSNFSVDQLREAQQALDPVPVVANQVRYSIIDRTIESGLLQYCQTNGVTVIAYCPLARGLDRITDCDPAGIIGEIARQIGRSPAQIILNWCLSRDGVVVIPKGNSVMHVLDNCGAAGWRLDSEHLQMLDARIRYRHRNRFDAFVRQHAPRPLRSIAVRAAGWLPPGLRRRIR